MDDVFVLVLCYTYNQEKYIEDALKGFVMQRTSFPFVAVVVDDASTDRTAEIIHKYENQYPDVIKATYLAENHYSKGLSKGKYSVEWWRKAKYIAMCEGDDYWTDPLKLQRQVDFLENNKDFTLCFHNVKVFKQNEGVLVDDFITREVPSETDIYNLVKGNYIHTPSVVYRKNDTVFRDQRRLGYSKVGDFPLWVLSAQYGKIKKFEECMAVYRYGTGFWSTVNDGINKLQVIIDIYEKFYKYFSLEDIAKRDCYFDVNKLIVDIKRILSQLYSKVSKKAYKNNDRKLYRKYYLKAIKMYPHKTRNIKEFLADYMFPVLYSKLRKKEIS